MRVIVMIALLLVPCAVHANGKTDWSVAMVESTMKRYPTAKDLGSWGYAKSLYLYGQYLVYKRTRDPRYLKVVTALEPLEPGATIVSAAFALISATGQNAASWKEEGASLVLDRPILSSAAVPPGDYRLRVAALDSTGRRGTVDFEFSASLQDAPPLKAGTLMTGVMQSSSFRPRMIFDASAAAVTGYIEMYGVMPPGSSPAVNFEIAPRPDAPALATTTGRVLGSSEPDRFVATGSVNIATLAPGDYVLRAVMSFNGQPAGRVFRTFRKD